MRVAVLGGGMAGLAAAWRLSDPAGPPCEVTVYQRGWRLGGKGASSRGSNGRIEEHGLHVWLGYYENAFRLLREAYAEIDRPRTAPDCPIRTWRDAFTPASVVGLGSDLEDGWDDWLAWFPEDDRLPGEAPPGEDSLDVVDFVRRALALIGRFGSSLGEPDGPAPRAVLTASPTPPRRARGVDDLAAALGVGLRSVARGGVASDRTVRFLELIGAMVRGILADGLLLRGFGAIDHLDLRDWLRSHGASEAAVDSPFVRGAYDLAFAYEGGDRARPRFAAGTGLLLTGRMFFAYRGSMFWKMRAGMGDVVFAPLYEALRRRGVRFRFLHRVGELHPSADGSTIEAVTLGCQADLAPGRAEYEPLVEVRGLPVFPDHLDLSQVDADPAIASQPLESHACTWPDARTVRLEAGRDYDHLVLAVSLGMVPHVAPQLVAGSARWQAMVDHVGTVATQAVQLWLSEDERALGWDHPAATITGCGQPLDTFASMTQTLPFEDWPPGAEPRTAASFCAVLEEDVATGPSPRTAVVTGAAAFLDERAPNLWPAAADPAGGFRWEVLAGAAAGSRGTDALASQYVRANTDPSDRYVQSLPGSAAHRLRADDSGFANLALAGDWVDSGLNAGCIEAATLGGLQAANAVLGRAIDHGTSGFRPTGARRGA
jgi:uncharacterized protein with NAD-binding domain and iron-sulfur cluster